MWMCGPKNRCFAVPFEAKPGVEVLVQKKVRALKEAVQSATFCSCCDGRMSLYKIIRLCLGISRVSCHVLTCASTYLGSSGSDIGLKQNKVQ